MIDLGLSAEYLAGYKARLNNVMFNENMSDEWRMGWINANQGLKLKPKQLRVRGAGLRIKMKYGETQEQAEDRLLDILEANGITCYTWSESKVEDD